MEVRGLQVARRHPQGEVKSLWADIPITAAARAALDAHLRRRPTIGAALLFTAPKGATRPLTKATATSGAYQHADAEGMLLAQESRRELREAR